MELPESHPLWLSPEGKLDSNGKGFAQWDAVAALPVKQSWELALARRQGLLNDAVEPPQKANDGNVKLKVDFQWRPVKLPSQLSMPRGWERMEQSPFFRPPAGTATVQQARMAQPRQRRFTPAADHEQAMT